MLVDAYDLAQAPDADRVISHRENMAQVDQAPSDSTRSYVKLF